MWKYIISLLLALCALSANARPDIARFDNECARAFGSTEWKYSQDVVVEALAKDYLLKFSMVVTPVVCLGNVDPFVFAQTHSKTLAGKKYYFIAFESEFRSAMSGDLPGVVAMIVARSALVTIPECNRTLWVLDYALCMQREHESDKLADGITWRGEVRRALLAEHRYVDQYLYFIHPGKADHLLRVIHGRVLLMGGLSRSNKRFKK